MVCNDFSNIKNKEFIISLLGYHFVDVDGFACPNDPKSYVVWGFMPHCMVTHGKQVLERSDKV